MELTCFSARTGSISTDFGVCLWSHNSARECKQSGGILSVSTDFGVCLRRILVLWLFGLGWGVSREDRWRGGSNHGVI